MHYRFPAVLGIVMLLIAMPALADNPRGSIDASRPLLQVTAGEGLSLARIADYPKRSIEQLEARFGEDLAWGRAYLFYTDEGSLRVNVLGAGESVTARAVASRLREIRAPEFVERRGTLIYEFATPDAALAKRARERITFRPTECSGLDGDPRARYLAAHGEPVDPSAPAELPLEARLGSFGGPRLFVAGEQHGIAENQLLEYAFLTYLHREANVRVYLQELPYSAGVLLDRYLQTGDETALETAFRGFSGTYSSSEELLELYRRVRRYNARLEDEDRIRLVGFDIEHQPHTAFHVVAGIIEGLEAPGEYAGLFERIRKIAGGPNSRSGRNESSGDELGDADARGSGIAGRTSAARMKEIASRALSAAEDEAEWFRVQLGENAFDFEIIMKNVVNLFEARGAEGERGWNRVRDRMMYENVLSIYGTLPEESSIFGQWGLNHVFQAKQFGVEWLAARLDSDQRSPLQGRVVSISYAYDDAMQKSKRAGNPQPLTSYVPDPGVALCNARGPYTLYRLDAPRSPYAEELSWMLATPRPESGVTTDYFQYLLLVRGGTASQPLGDDSF
ncbi:MAG: hypothetical protein GVY23_02235 [Spirochaetes bacterium]|jgi:erythromycin esterase|nr:hypothetical protein [Spirochaetota bacterium]